jgi:hypothetical protein
MSNEDKTKLKTIDIIWSIKEDIYLVSSSVGAAFFFSPKTKVWIHKGDFLTSLPSVGNRPDAMKQ